MKHIKLITDEQLLEQISGGAIARRVTQVGCPLRQVISRLEALPIFKQLASLFGGGVQVKKAA